MGERSSLAKSPARERSRGDASDIDGQTERSNGAFGKSDIEGKVARVAARKRGRDRVSSEREHRVKTFEVRSSDFKYDSLFLSRIRKRFTMHEPNNCRGRRVACEWSERDERHRRQSCEGSSERVRARSEFQKSAAVSLCDAPLAKNRERERRGGACLELVE